MALGDAILVCLTERPMTGYELAKTFDSSIGFFWKADHQQIYRELTRLRDKGHVLAREVVQSGKPNKLVYTLTPAGKVALRHWSARPSSPPSIKDDMLVRLCALDAVDIEPMRADLMARLEYHRDRLARYERMLVKRFPHGAESLARFASVPHRPPPLATHRLRFAAQDWSPSARVPHPCGVVPLCPLAHRPARAARRDLRGGRGGPRRSPTAVAWEGGD